MSPVRSLSLGFCFTILAAASANAACLSGAYSASAGDPVVVTNPPTGGRYTFVDGRKGALSDADALVRCVDGAISVRNAEGWTPVERMPMRLTPTRFKSGKLTLAGMLVEPVTAQKPPLVVFVHGSEKTPAVGSLYSYILAAQGVSTFVFDKRGTGNSEGAYTQNFQWLADDVVAASKEAKRLAAGRYSRFALTGGSQGGWIAPLAANRAGAEFVFVGFGLVLSPLEEDAEQVFDELRRKGADAATLDKARQVTDATGAVMASHFTGGYDQLARVKALYGKEPWFNTIEGEFTGEVLHTDPAELRRSGRDKLDKPEHRLALRRYGGAEGREGAAAVGHGRRGPRGAGRTVARAAGEAAQGGRADHRLCVSAHRPRHQRIR